MRENTKKIYKLFCHRKLLSLSTISTLRGKNILYVKNKYPPNKRFLNILTRILRNWKMRNGNLFTQHINQHYDSLNAIENMYMEFV